jgi:hypothetical protein
MATQQQPAADRDGIEAEHCSVERMMTYRYCLCCGCRRIELSRKFLLAYSELMVEASQMWLSLRLQGERGSRQDERHAIGKRRKFSPDSPTIRFRRFALGLRAMTVRLLLKRRPAFMTRDRLYNEWEKQNERTFRQSDDKNTEFATCIFFTWARAANVWPCFALRRLAPEVIHIDMIEKLLEVLKRMERRRKNCSKMPRSCSSSSSRSESDL